MKTAKELQIDAKRRQLFQCRGCGLIDNQRDCVRQLERAACGTIGDVGARELERQPGIVATADVELRGMICEGEQMLPKKLTEAKLCGIEHQSTTGRRPSGECQVAC